MDVFKAYLTLITIIFAGYGISIQAKAFFVGITLSIFSIVLATIFYLLDVRTVQLIKIAERFLLKDEKRISKLLKDRDIEFFRKSDLLTHVSRVCGLRLSYGNLFRVFYALNALLSLIVCFIFFGYLSI